MSAIYLSAAACIDSARLGSRAAGLRPWPKGVRPENGFAWSDISKSEFPRFDRMNGLCRLAVAVTEMVSAKGLFYDSRNTNRLLGVEGYSGVKTGTTHAAGCCLAAHGERGGRGIIVVVLGSTSTESRYADTRNLFRHAWHTLGVP